MKDYDFLAELKYKTTEEGGRETPAKSGYRPHVKFKFSEMLTSGRQIFLDTELVYPGDTIIAEIAIYSPQFFENKLEEGIEFEFCEGRHIVGSGKILKIENKLLKKS